MILRGRRMTADFVVVCSYHWWCYSLPLHRTSRHSPESGNPLGDVDPRLRRG